MGVRRIPRTRSSKRWSLRGADPAPHRREPNPTCRRSRERLRADRPRSLCDQRSKTGEGCEGLAPCSVGRACRHSLVGCSDGAVRKKRTVRGQRGPTNDNGPEKGRRIKNLAWGG